MYRIIVITDPYTGSRNVGFKYSANRGRMYKVLDRYEDIGLARKEFFNLLRSKAEMYPEYWDCESLEEAAKVTPNTLLVFDDKFHATFDYDVYMYVLENESDEDSIVLKEYSKKDIENKLQELIDNGAHISDDEERDALDSYYATKHLDAGKWIKINGDYYDLDEFVDTYLNN